MKNFNTTMYAVSTVVICVAMLFVSCTDPATAVPPLGSEGNGEGGYISNGKYFKSDNKGTYEDFIEALWIRESSIDPGNIPEYNDKFNKPYTQYQIVERPGRVIRDNNGHPTLKMMTVQEYFKTIGVLEYFKLGSSDPEMIRRMQAATTNFLGFIGFQFADGDLRDLEYYRHVDDKGYPMYYTDLPDSTWANGVRNIYRNENGVTHHYTDVNTWTGEWLGKNGINSLQDFINPDKHVYVIKDHLELKHDNTVKALVSKDKKLEDYIGTVVYWNQLNPKVVPPPGGRSNTVTITMSGLTAGAHLRGAAGVVSLLVDHENPADEIGTHILEYVQDYGDYSTPWDKK